MMRKPGERWVNLTDAATGKPVRKLRIPPGGLKITAQTTDDGKKTRIPVGPPTDDDKRKQRDDIVAKLEAMRRAFAATPDEQERAHILVGVINFAPFHPIPQWALNAWYADLMKKLGRRKQQRKYRAALTEDAVEIFREARRQDPTAPRERHIATVSATVGVDPEKLRGALRRSRHWRTKRKKPR
jgi:hypothetical protein